MNENKNFSIKNLKKQLKIGEEILSVTRKEYSLPLTKKKLTGLTEVVRGFIVAENYFLKNFSAILGLEFASYPRKLRDGYVCNGLPEELIKLGLQDRQWKLALDVAFMNINASLALTHKEVNTSVNLSQKLSDPEKHLIRYLLQRTDLLSLICLGRFKDAEKLLILDSASTKFNRSLKEKLEESDGKVAKMNRVKVFKWLRRRYREVHKKHQSPVIKKIRTYHLDSSMFKFFKEGNTSYISVASMTPNRRIVIPLTNKNLDQSDFVGNIKLILRKDGKVEIHRAINKIVKKLKMSPLVLENCKNKMNKVVAIDKGMKDLINTDADKKFGAGYSKKLIKWSDVLTQINSGRARFHSMIRELHKNIAKTTNLKVKRKLQDQIVRIEKNNLGSQKIDKKREFIKLEIKKELGTAVNQLFKNEQPNVLITENLKFISFKNLGRRINRLLSSWSKGTLRDVLELGAKKNGVLLAEVNAAFTSQQCRNCGHVHRDNRRGDVFACVACQHKENADFAAAKNVKDRFFDSEIDVFTPVSKVREILLKRHRVRLSTLGLNESANRSSSANDRKIA